MGTVTAVVQGLNGRVGTGTSGRPSRPGRVPGAQVLSHQCHSAYLRYLVAALVGLGLAVRAALQVDLGPRFKIAIGATQCTVAAPRAGARPDHVSCTIYGIVCTYIYRSTLLNSSPDMYLSYHSKQKRRICIQRAPVNAPTNLTRYHPKVQRYRHSSL